MDIINYINCKRADNQQITNLFELTDQEYVYYTRLRAREFAKPYVPKPRKPKKEKPVKEPKEKKVRADKNKKRVKYDSSLPHQYREYLSRANRKQIVFSLSVEEFTALSSGTCVYCLAPATGIDRKNSKKGYTISNSQSCCSKCNWMKGQLREDDFIEHCQRIVSVYYKS